ncbi:hypothetical protein ACFYZJ_31235 [Streptomyces sp. NPDC001848]|uniref:hypothetical protein n=1 Tax=Streptomyces sp. NPDC001848 TaxID=3364618 RepID=UPI0036B51CD6
MSALLGWYLLHVVDYGTLQGGAGEQHGSGLDEFLGTACLAHLDGALAEEDVLVPVEDPLFSPAALVVQPGDRYAVPADGVGGVVDGDDAGDLRGGLEQCLGQGGGAGSSRRGGRRSW